MSNVNLQKIEMGPAKNATNCLAILECAARQGRKTMRKNKSLDDEILEIEIRLIRHLIDMMSFETQIGLKKRLKKLRVEKSWQELVREISDSRRIKKIT